MPKNGKESERNDAGHKGKQNNAHKMTDKHLVGLCICWTLNWNGIANSQTVINR